MDVFEGHGMAAHTLCFSMFYVQSYRMRNIYELDPIITKFHFPICE